jgi:iron complex transport system substrate-binding protein
MLNLPYRDTWFMPPKDSYMVRLIEDAGGEYVLADSGQQRAENTASASQPISLEKALVLASKADFWLNLGQTASLEELRAVAPRFAKVDAVRLGRVYNNTKRTNKSRGSDFWESGAVRPDVILEDLIKILHHKAQTEELYYYKQLE